MAFCTKWYVYSKLEPRNNQAFDISTELFLLGIGIDEHL